MIESTSRVSPSASELSHASIGQWGAVIAGVLGGFGAAILMATLGVALGLTAVAGAVDAVSADGAVDRSDVGALGIGALAWLLVSAVVVGAAGGVVLARSSRPDRAFNAGTLGLLTWTGGMVLAVLLSASPAAGVGTGGLAAAAAQDSRSRLAPAAPAAARDLGTPVDASVSRPALSEAERMRLQVAAEDAARAATVAAWAALLAQGVSLIVTILAARMHRRGLIAAEPVAYATAIAR